MDACPMPPPNYLGQPCPRLDVSPCNHNIRKTRVISKPSLYGPAALVTLAVVTQNV